MLVIKEKKLHRIKIEFDIDVAPEFASQIKNDIEKYFWTFLGYPTYILGLGLYSFDQPELPEKITVEINETNKK